MLEENEDYWIEYFDKCEWCGEETGRGIEVYTDKEKQQTIHLCVSCFEDFKRKRKKCQKENI